MKTAFGNRLRRISVLSLNLGTVAALCVLTSVFVFAYPDEIGSDTRRDSSESVREEFKSFLKEFQKLPSETSLRSFRRRHSGFDVSPCYFEESGRFETVRYLSFHCDGETWKNFIQLGSASGISKRKLETVSLGEAMTIGKKVFLEIKPASSVSESGKESVFDRTEKTKHERENPIRPTTVKEPKDNFGLRYFLSIAKHPSKRDLNPGKEIFFDSTCPLVFLKKDSDFYWDKAVYYSFQASCIPSSPYSYIRIKADFLGKIRMDDKDTDQIQEGAKYLGKLRIHSVEADKILWRDAEIYNE
ncbi:hypothetical protein CH379_012540 [Leptospira ellisii]|uniref:Uncharacterized protein n=1 Tax=Leptospira ellisii TaxID=2023197 RepID=A0AAE4QP97_9LEPT|nr:hypothetical protein [Leptospira ellisii]MDV6236456.1 hypothetical protein [Leptospira ellisii]